MVKELEKWISINNLTPEIEDLFRESIKCYKALAYKSAYLMAFIGLNSILRERIMNSNIIPSNFNQIKWNEIRSKLTDDDTWDNEIVNCVNRQKPNIIFLISDSDIKQYDALRAIRNICAHGKKGKVSIVQVEFLWDYIISNSHSFVINGGIDGIKQMVIQHYDITITPPNTDLNYIIDNIHLSLRGSDLTDLLDWLYTMSQKRNGVVGPCFEEHNKYINLWDKLYESDEGIRKSIIKYVKETRSEEIIYFIERYGSAIDDIFEDEAFVRKIWTAERICDGFRLNASWRILERIIESNLVPENEKEFFNKRLYYSMSKFFPEDKVELLQKTDFFDRYKKEFINHDNYKYDAGGIFNANYNAQYFFRYIKIFDLDIESVRSINEIFSFAEYGNFYDDTKALMKTDSYLEKYKLICAENGLIDYSHKF